MSGSASTGGNAEPGFRIGSVTFAGAFEPAEREFLAGQFGRCSFTLIGRSSRDPRLAVAKWRPYQGGGGAGPAPLFGPPSEAAYVVDRTGAAPELVRVDSDADLAAHFAGHFPGLHLNLPVWDRIRRGVRRVFPGWPLV